MNDEHYTRDELKPIFLGFVKHYISKRNVIDKRSLYNIRERVERDRDLPSHYRNYITKFLKRENFHKGMTEEEVFRFWSPVFEKPVIIWEDRPKNVLEELFED